MVTSPPPLDFWTFRLDTSDRHKKWLRNQNVCFLDNSELFCWLHFFFFWTNSPINFESPTTEFTALKESSSNPKLLFGHTDGLLGSQITAMKQSKEDPDTENELNGFL